MLRQAKELDRYKLGARDGDIGPTTTRPRTGASPRRTRTFRTQETILNAPEFTQQALISRDHEEELHRHHNRQGYWEAELARVA